MAAAASLHFFCTRLDHHDWQPRVITHRMDCQKRINCSSETMTLVHVEAMQRKRDSPLPRQSCNSDFRHDSGAPPSQIWVLQGYHVYSVVATGTVARARQSNPALVARAQLLICSVSVFATADLT